MVGSNNKLNKAAIKFLFFNLVEIIIENYLIDLFPKNNINLISTIEKSN